MRISDWSSDVCSSDLSVCARLDIAPARVLMPLSFATLLGGLCSLTGTPANLIVNGWKISETGAGFAYFELAWVGLPVALRSEEHTSALQSLMRISYAVFCLKKKTNTNDTSQ